MAPMTVTSSPRDGCARAPTLSMRAMTAWMSSSVAVGFMTIIIWLLLKGTWTETVRRVRAPALGPSARGAGGAYAPTERLTKSPGAIRVETAVRPGPGSGEDGGRRGHARMTLPSIRGDVE